MTKTEWNKLRTKFFKECVWRDMDGNKIRIDFAPHDLFEWFKKEINANYTLLNEPEMFAELDEIEKIR